MASTSSLPEEDYSCPVCHRIFKDPVILSCGYSFCTDCLQEEWQDKGIGSCPLCKEIHSARHPPPPNLALKNVCEAFKVKRETRRASKRKITSSGSEDDQHRCNLHAAEELKLFCLECQQPVCAVCGDTEKHKHHSFRPINEAALDYMAEVQKSLETLQEKLEVFKEVKSKSDQTAKHMKVQYQNTQSEIKRQYNTLYQCLRRKQEASLAALREEEEKKNQTMEEKIGGLNRDILTLSNIIKAIEEELKAGHVLFLQNYKTTVKIVQYTLQDPQPVSGPLMDVNKHLGNLAFRVWEEMKDIVSYTPVTLDPNTAQLIRQGSDELGSGSRGERQRPLPDNPKRFEHCPGVLGSEGFNSGTHSWYVEVGNVVSECWTLGVLAEPCQSLADGGAQLWCITLEGGNYRARSTGPDIVLSLKQRPQRIRIQLDRNEGKISFSDAVTDTHMHTFTPHTFTETLIPFFWWSVFLTRYYQVIV